MCPDLVSAEYYDDLVTTVIRTTLTILALRRALIKSHQIETLIERILEVVPLQLAIKIISGPFYTSKTSRIRIAAILFMEIVIARAYQVELNSMSNNKIETQQSVSYIKMVDVALMKMNDDFEISGQHKDSTISSIISRKFQSMTVQCQVCLTDAGISNYMILVGRRILFYF